MRLIESVSEKPLQEETNIFVRRILPLNHVYGCIFVTDLKVYFEPFHSLLGKAVHTIELSDLSKLFKRRFELQEVFKIKLDWIGDHYGIGQVLLHLLRHR